MLPLTCLLLVRPRAGVRTRFTFWHDSNTNTRSRHRAGLSGGETTGHWHTGGRGWGRTALGSLSRRVQYPRCGRMSDKLWFKSRNTRHPDFDIQDSERGSDRWILSTLWNMFILLYIIVSFQCNIMLIAFTQPNLYFP